MDVQGRISGGGRESAVEHEPPGQGLVEPEQRHFETYTETYLDRDITGVCTSVRTLEPSWVMLVSHARRGVVRTRLNSRLPLCELSGSRCSDLQAPASRGGGRVHLMSILPVSQERHVAHRDHRRVDLVTVEFGRQAATGSRRRDRDTAARSRRSRRRCRSRRRWVGATGGRWLSQTRSARPSPIMKTEPTFRPRDGHHINPRGLQPDRGRAA